MCASASSNTVSMRSESRSPDRASLNSLAAAMETTRGMTPTTSS